MLKFLGLILFFTIAFDAQSQSKTKAELVRDYNRMHHKVKLYQKIDLDSGQMYIDTLFEITEELNQDYYLGKAFQVKSLQFMESSSPDSALYYCDKSILLLNQYPDSMDYFVAQYNLGTIYLQFRDHIHALVQFKSVLQLIDEKFEYLVRLDQEKVNLNRAYAYVSIGLVYSQLKDHQNALTNLNKGIKISWKVNTRESENLRAVTLGHVSLAHYHLGNLDKAETFAVAGIEQKTKLKMTGAVGFNYQVLAKIALQRDKIDLCLKYLSLSDKKFTAFNNHIELNRNDFIRAQCAYKHNHLDEGMEILSKLEPIYQLSFPDEEVAELAQLQSDIYAATGDYKKAYEKSILATAIREEVFLKNDREMVGEFLHFFETEEERLNDRLQSLRNKQAKEKLELQIEGDNAKKIWAYTLFIVSILGLLFVIFIIAKAYQRNKRINQDLSDSIHENEVLFREVHHRVKNNFQIISSLLSLQQGIEEDAHGKKVLTDAQSRIQSMALVHEMLYQRNEVNRIDFKSHSTELVSSILKSFSDGEMIEFKVRSADESFDLEVAIPIGLILNEAITNSVKYAFNELKIGKIVIDLESLGDDTYRLTIKDNGVGIPEEYINGNADTLGLELINILSGQLNGKTEVYNDSGTKLVITFEAKTY